MNVLKIDTDIVYAVGDIHGEFNSILFNIKRFDLKDCVIVFCGDIGMGFNRKEYYRQTFTKISKELKSRNIHLVFIRGNHDDDSYFTTQQFKFKYIHLIPDYTVVKTNRQNILCVGGGVSVDRISRIAMNDKYAAQYRMHHKCTIEEANQKCPKCYWENEKPIYNELFFDEIKTLQIPIHTVCTHTCPSFAKPINKDGIGEWLKMDEQLDADLTYERNVMDKIYNRLVEDNHPLSDWCYGHFHWHNREFGLGGITFTLLDMCRNGAFDMVEIRKKEEKE